jgi:hypothetical protein
VGVVGILRRWRWLFWCLLLAFGVSVLRVPILAAQWAGLGGSGEPAWYDLARGAVSLLQGGIAAWMVALYRRYGVWACGHR